jgi:hypothetical protein
MGHSRLAPAASKRCAYLRAPILRVVWSVHRKLQSSATIQSTLATPIVLFEKGIADPRSPQSSAETQKHDVVSAARSFTVLGGFDVAFSCSLSESRTAPPRATTREDRETPLHHALARLATEVAYKTRERFSDLRQSHPCASRASCDSIGLLDRGVRHQQRA